MKYLFIIGLFLLAFEVQAESVAKTSDIPNNLKCIQENTTLTVTLTGVENNFAEAKDKFDKSVNNAINVAKKAGIEKPKINSEYVNIYAQNARFEYNGSISLIVDKSSKAISVADQLQKQGLQVNISISKYDNCQQGAIYE